MRHAIRSAAPIGFFILMLAACPAQAQVRSGDAFSFDLTGYDAAGTIGYYLAGPLTGTFGTTQTFAGAGINGQDITITSSEVIGMGMNTATFTVSTPTSFLTSNTVQGTSVTLLQFDLGNAASGGNTVDFVQPITSYSATGSTIYGAGASLAPVPITILSNASRSLSASEAVSGNTTPIAGFNFRSFTYTITYAAAGIPAVPEPGSWLLMLVGFGVVAATLRRTRQRLAFSPG